MHRKYQSFTQNCLKAPAPYVAWCAETYDTAKMSSKLRVRSAEVFLRTGQWREIQGTKQKEEKRRKSGLKWSVQQLKKIQIKCIPEKLTCMHICLHTSPNVYACTHMHNFININNTGNCVKSKNSNYESIYIFLHSTLNFSNSDGNFRQIDKYRQNNFQWLCLIYTSNYKNKYEHIITIKYTYNLYPN